MDRSPSPDGNRLQPTASTALALAEDLWRDDGKQCYCAFVETSRFCPGLGQVVRWRRLGSACRKCRESGGGMPPTTGVDIRSRPPLG